MQHITQVYENVPCLKQITEITGNLRKGVKAGKNFTGREKVTKPFKRASANQLQRQMIYEWRKFSTTAALPGSDCLANITPRARQIIRQEVKKKKKTLG